MAWWQKKLLRYALSRTGLLDDEALDPNNLDITLGKRNVIELKDVGLNIQKISQIAQLPPCLRIEAARVLSLRLTVPADIYQSSIVAEVDGVELSLTLDEKDEASSKAQKSRARSPLTTRNPQHRKAHRRIHSPPPYDPGGLSEADDTPLPTTEQLAKSFLLQEPVQGRRELEASVIATEKNLDDSMLSESSDGNDLGTGAAIGLPTFLANFLQGIVDRFQIVINNVQAKLDTELSGDGQTSIPLTLRLNVGSAELTSSSLLDDAHKPHSDQPLGERQVKISDISLHIMSDADVFSDLSELPSHSSPAESRQRDRSPVLSKSSLASRELISNPNSRRPIQEDKVANETGEAQDLMQASVLTADADRFADVGDHDDEALQRSIHHELDIQPGDDNISWGSRRSKSNAPVEDLWNSMASEDDLPESLLLHRDDMPRFNSSTNTTQIHRRQDSPEMDWNRRFHGPGSWPRLEESPDRARIQQSPGSWPTIDHAQQASFQAIVPEPEAQTTTLVDNKRTALQASMIASEFSENSSDSQTEPADDMTSSRFFTHEKAESMYMSAMSQSVRMQIPGGWNSEDSQTESALPQDTLPAEPTNRTAIPKAVESPIDPDISYEEEPYLTPDNLTPRAPSPSSPVVVPPKPAQLTTMTSRQLVHLDLIHIWIPKRTESDSPIDLSSSSHERTNTKVAPNTMPGSFSMYSEMSASRRRIPGLSKQESKSDVLAPLQAPPERGPLHPTRIEVGVITCQVDMSCGRLLQRFASRVLIDLENPNKSERSPLEENTKPSNAASVTISEMTLALKESTGKGLLEIGSFDPSANLLTVSCHRIAFSSTPPGTDIRLGNLALFVGASQLLSFNRSPDMLTSMMISDQTPAIAVSLKSSKGASKRHIRELTIETLPLDVVFSLPVIDETFNSFGGLSGLLEVGGSILSESDMGSPLLSPTKASKGVRFEGEPSPAATETELKINTRLGGISMTLHGTSSAVELRTTTVKAVYREQGAVLTMEQINVTGPYERSSDNTKLVSIDFFTTRLEYLLTPQDKDLERLLSLLTPSKDKYDTDDDILLDTLFRQRKKGAVARASITEIRAHLEDWTFVQPLSNLVDELGKLSAVAKYLPEDERPGLLTLVRVKESNFQLPVNERFGKLRCKISDIHCAHIGLPALFALSVGDINASQANHNAVIRSLVQLSGSDNLPVVMARMLGDEIEPTVKIKIFNICLEYSVPLILALTELDDQASKEEVITELAQSVANLSLYQERNKPSYTRTRSDVSGSSKKMKIDLLVHDSAIGLSPQNLSSKALLVFTDAHFSVSPSEEIVDAELELRKAGVFVADQVLADDNDVSVLPRASPNNTATKPKLTASLSRRGFVSVGSIMAAKILVRAEPSSRPETKTIDVEFTNHLLLLETCADSTQTLIATLSGLLPPTPPSKQPKYHTEPMTIEEMMASFTGDAFERPERPPQTLFDVEEESEDDPMLSLDVPTLGENDDLLSESEMTSSLYGPVSGILEPMGSMGDDDESNDFPETAESLLEDDPFEMANIPMDASLSDGALLRELNKQCKRSSSLQPLDLGLEEYEDLVFDALGGNQSVLGVQERFNTPDGGRRGKQKIQKRQDLPFKLKMRDLHIIWNIYDGYDWQRTREGITQAVEEVERRAEERKARRHQSANEREEEESVIEDFLFNSIYIGVPSSHDAQELRRQINCDIDELASETDSMPMSGMSKPTTVFSTSGRPARSRQRRRLKLERSRAHKIAFELKGVSADILVFPEESTEVVSSVDVRVRDFEIFDNVPSSTWRKFLTHLSNEPGDREMSKPMVHLELSNVRTLENFSASEIVIHVSLLPLRLHVDQDALDFITRFFAFKDSAASTSTSPAEQPFLQRVEVDTVDLCLDYKPKKVDYVGLRSGHTTEFMNFIILEAANIRLKHAIIYGIKGFDPLHQTLNDIWMPDVKRNQLPTVLAGLAPVRSLVNIGSGVRDVVAIPVREYQKDGRIVRSIQKGAFQFGKTTASELARLGAKVAMGTQTLLQGAEGFLTPISNSPGRPSPISDQPYREPGVEDEKQESRAISAYASQPFGVLPGLRSAQRHLEYDLLTARDALIAVQGEILESAGPTDAAAAIARHAPTIILRPIIGTSRAVGTALLGVGNQIDRDNVRRVEDKYKRR